MAGLLAPGSIPVVRVARPTGFGPLVASVGLLVSCVPDALHAPPDPPAPGPLYVTFGVNVSPGTVAPGDTFTVGFGVRNGSGRDTWVTASCHVLATAVVVQDGAQVPFEGSETGCDPGDRTFDLPAGGALEWEGTFVARVRVSGPEVGGAGSLEDALPGDYTVRITPRVTGFDGRPLTLRPMEKPFRVRVRRGGLGPG